MLAQRFGPEAVAMPISMGPTFFLGDEADIAADGGFFFDAAQITAQRRAWVDAEQPVFEAVTKFERELLFGGRGEGDGLDLPTELLLGFFGELHAKAGRVDAAALHFWESENPVKLLF